MEQVPHIAQYCHEVQEQLCHVVPSHLLPIVVKYLTDYNLQVRKTSQAALLVLLEQGLVEKSDVEDQVCPIIIRFTEVESLDDYKTESVALLSKMAPLIGKDMSERLFLHRFAALCLDPLFHVRKVCAANFGDFSGAVGPEATEQVLLPKFFYLCDDGVWGVRKACADVFMPVSCVCSPAVRQTELSPLFLKLLRDHSRWVRMAAFQALGPFISTFADPAITALLHNENGEIIITDTKQLAERLDQLERLREERGRSEKCSSSQLGDNTQQNRINNNLNNPTATNTSSSRGGSDNNCSLGETTSDSASIVTPLSMEMGGDEEWTSELVVTLSGISPEEKRAQKRHQLTTATSSTTPTSAPSEDGGTTTASIRTPSSTSEEEATQSINNNNIDSSNSKSISSSNSSSLSTTMELSTATPPQEESQQQGQQQSLRNLSNSSTSNTSSVNNINNNNSSSNSRSSNNNNNNESPKTGEQQQPTNFSSFLYWREPVADVDLVDIDLEDTWLEEQDTEMTELEEPAQELSGITSATSGVLREDEDDEMPELAAIQSSLDKLDSESSTDEDSEMSSTGGEEDQEQIQSSTSGKAEETATESSITSHGDKVVDQESRAEGDNELTSSQSADDSESWSNLPVITFEKFDNITGDQANSTMELFRPGEKEETISTFDPKSSWEYNLSSKESASGASTPSQSESSSVVDFQSIVPQLLIDNFVSMTDPSQAQMVDNDIARHCAYSLPAVALTLGRSNWHLLKDTYEALANDLQWKVRRTLASSIHELAIILGVEVATRDLVPIFNGFIKDLDEVRIGILKHLADFLKLLEERDRLDYLPKLEEFLKIDNDKIWRYRLEVAEQLGLLVPLFCNDDIRTYLAPLAFSLVQDKVAAVRLTATGVIAKIIKTLDKDQSTHLSSELADKLAHSPQWVKRQTFVILCGEVVQSLPFEIFCQDLLPHLIDLTWDRVANVRLHVARVLGQLLPQEYYDDENCEHHDTLVQSLTQLAADRDHDVREAAVKANRVEENPPPPPATSTTSTTTTDSTEDNSTTLESGELTAPSEPTTIISTTDGEEDEADKKPPSWAEIAAADDDI